MKVMDTMKFCGLVWIFVRVGGYSTVSCRSVSCEMRGARALFSVAKIPFMM